MKNFEIDRHRLSHLSLTQIYLALYFTTMRDTQWSEPLPTNEPVKREVKVENSSVVHVTGAALRRPCTETSKWTVDVLAQRALQTFLTKAHAFTKLSPWKPSVESHGSSLSSSPKDDFSLSPLVWKHKRYLNSISSFIAKKKCGTTILTGLVNRWQKSCVAGYAMSWQLPFSYRINLQLWNLLPHKLYFRCTSMAEDLCACANLGTLWKFVISYQLVLRTLVGVRLGIARLG